ncbi:polymorphic toxin-type HINT domain-containing protein [Gimesia maris]|uniref:polymorphic toxin-type HINT domain-containing protein n=1 Tax=Gimesia maris TaxID=122 RepID=UPI0018D7E831|nr:polymorphic toxin-type HINT domain-containing protein [Gimesia maris]
MSDLTRKIVIFSYMLLTGLCFWKAAPGLVGGADASMLPSAQAAVLPSVTQPRVVTTPIQQMRPGMRVVGRNPIRIQTESTIDPTPEGWRLVSVRMRKEDGTYFEAELLRPLSWIYQHRAQPGAVIELNMPELHVVGSAEVLSISDCPPIDPGDGPIVLSTFKNIANNVLNLYMEGETEPIGVTAGHPIWSEDRQAFIHSDQLQPGERLRSPLGKTVRITSIEIRAGPEPVYNLEVAGEHVYSVTGSGLLVHNVSDCDLVTKIGLPDGSYIDLNAPTTVSQPTQLSWNQFRSQVGGHGYSQTQISRFYKKYLSSKGIDPTGQSKRLQYLGSTPGKNSATGRAVIDRMRADGRVMDTPAGTFVRDGDGTFYPLAEMDMGHNPTDAVRFWNTTGIQHCPKSPAVRQWMLDPNNYELQHFSRNRSLGAQLGETYIDP